MPTADRHAADVHDRVVRVELAVAALERLRHARHGVHDAETADEVHIHACRVAHETENGLIHSLGNVDIEPLTFQPVDELVALILRDAVL